MNHPTTPIKVYSNPLSGHSHRVRLMLGLLDLPHVVVDIPMPDQKLPAFLAKSPFGEIPVIEDGDYVLYDSTAILVYLATRYDESGAWLPRDPKRAAAVQRWLSFAAGQIYSGPNSARLVKVFGVALDHDRAKAITLRFFDVVERELSEQPYAAGGSPTIADVAAYSYVALAPEGDVPLEAYPSIRAWLARIEAWPRFVPMHRGGLATLGR